MQHLTGSKRRPETPLSAARFNYAAPRLGLLLLLLLSACSGIRVGDTFSIKTELHSQIIDQREDSFPDIDTLALSDDIIDLLDQMVPPGMTQLERVAAIQEILYSPDYLNLQYSDNRTHTAVEVFEHGDGNCLSAMNLYVAMARHVGLNAHFQTVEVRPNYDRRGDLLVLSQHINATGKVGRKSRYVVDFTPEIALQQLTARVVSDTEARALYFNNLGVEAMIEGDMELALRYLKNSLYLDREESITWNNIGTAFNRLGRADLGVYSYQMAHRFDNSNGMAISNLAKHYRTIGDDRRADEYEQAVERYNANNPYYHFARGKVAYFDDDLESARDAFREAIRLKEFEPEFFTALAKVYFDLGEMKEAYAINEYAKQLLAENEEIYLPSMEKMRIIDRNTIIGGADAGTVIGMPN